MTEPRTLLIAMRVSESRERAMGATRTPCSVCSVECWVSPSSAEAAGASAIVVCLGCAPGDLEVQPLTEGQQAEIVSHFARGAS